MSYNQDLNKFSYVLIKIKLITKMKDIQIK